MQICKLNAVQHEKKLSLEYIKFRSSRHTEDRLSAMKSNVIFERVFIIASWSHISYFGMASILIFGLHFKLNPVSQHKIIPLMTFI